MFIRRNELKLIAEDWFEFISAKQNYNKIPD